MALRTLATAGVPTRLYEARRRLGGRIFTRTDFPIAGSWVEMGGQLVNSDHADMFALIKDFGLELIDGKALGGVDQAVRDRQAGRRGSARRRARRRSRRRSPQDSARLDADWDGRRARARCAVGRGLSRPPCGSRSAIRRRAACSSRSIRTEYGAEPDQASALAADLEPADRRRPGLRGCSATSDERYVVKGGSQRVTDALVEDHGARIETGHKLVALAPADGGRVTLRFASGNETTVDRVILAAPAEPARRRSTTAGC